jgi:hypothetical protein
VHATIWKLMFLYAAACFPAIAPVPTIPTRKAPPNDPGTF